MVDKPSVGLIGIGAIGGAVYECFLHYTDVKAYDINAARSTHNYIDVINQDIVFLCLNTPMQKDGRVDTSIVEEVLNRLEENVTKPGKPVIIKSTIPPADLGRIMLAHAENLLVIYNPEFLTERSARHEFIQSNRFIFGTLQGFDITPEAKLVEQLFNLRFPNVPQYWCSFAEASLVKYVTNVFFATKVSFMNEVAQIAENWGLDSNELISKVLLDPRIGRSHYQVPGHDGNKGFGGACFVKDLTGYLHIAKDAEVDAKLARAVWNKNLEVRGVTDITDYLNSMVGKVVSEPVTVDEVFDIGRD